MKTGDRVRLVKNPAWRKDVNPPEVGDTGRIVMVVDSEPDKLFVEVDGHPCPDEWDAILALAGVAPSWPLTTEQVELLEQEATA